MKMKYFGYRAPAAQEEKRLSRLKKAYRARSVSHLFDILLTEADEKILSKNLTIANTTRTR